MYYLELDNPNRPQLSGWLVISALMGICMLAFLWGWKTSGVLENTMLFDSNPLGYSYLLETYHFGLWPINREAFYYLNGMQAFLGVPETAINVGNGYEISRILYCLLLRSFWFLEPIVASFVLDILLWFLAAISAAYIVATFSKNKYAPWIAVCTVMFGQGFLHSVGEGMPHVFGYVGGFYLTALICLFRTWQKTCRFNEDIIIYIFIGLWQIGYGTALFFLPFALLCSWHRLRKHAMPLKQRYKIVFIFITISVIPFCLISLIMRIMTKIPGELGLVLNGMQKYSDIFAYAKALALTSVDGLLSLGPIITLATCVLFYDAIKKKYKDLQYISLVFLLSYLGMIFLITPLTGRGYATFNLIVIPMIFFTIKLSSMIDSNRYGKFLAIVAVLVMMIYPNSMKFNFVQPNRAFHAGWLQRNISKFQAYEIHFFK